MYQTHTTPTRVPTVDVCINKSRLKKYQTSGKLPTYYLQTGTEFQIELFNPTQQTILAKIEINGRLLSQGGLVLKPGQKIYLERYLDVARKFKFDTYEVENSAEAKKAIEDNGDLRIQFFNEVIPYTPPYYYGNILINTTTGGPTYLLNPTTTSIGLTNLNGDLSSYTTSCCSDSLGDNGFPEQTLGDNGFPEQTLGFMDQSLNFKYQKNSIPRTLRGRSLSKSIETGRVEMGQTSNQKFNTVDIDFQTFPFHTVSYKLLPISQKQLQEEDIKVKVYCTACGHKLKPEFKFCPSCGCQA